MTSIAAGQTQLTVSNNPHGRDLALSYIQTLILKYEILENEFRFLLLFSNRR